ncbi:CRISPR system Cascade subunit CasE [Pseudomonas sp. IT-194MI4]|uniref:type I-E CRISPR-associated protein Cas6/Cse3/CasE n=1 Tax=Pseudomonas sp. IT-194MI4 TaxID=3026443 RepID=UPI0039DFD8EB
MIASVLHLDRKAIRDLKVTDCYSVHRVVYSLFDDVRNDAQKIASESSGILFADQGYTQDGRRILLLTDRAPKDGIDGAVVDIRSLSISDDFLGHGQYRFKVIVNPTRRSSNSKALVPIKGAEAIAQWFVERASSSWGFVVNPANLSVGPVKVVRFQEKANRQVTIAQTHIEGVLSVVDHEQLSHSFRHGIGRARAWGCGLLQLTPVSHRTH